MIFKKDSKHLAIFKQGGGAKLQKYVFLVLEISANKTL